MRQRLSNAGQLQYQMLQQQSEWLKSNGHSATNTWKIVTVLFIVLIEHLPVQTAGKVIFLTTPEFCVHSTTQWQVPVSIKELYPQWLGIHTWNNQEMRVSQHWNILKSCYHRYTSMHCGTEHMQGSHFWQEIDILIKITLWPIRISSFIPVFLDV